MIFSYCLYLYMVNNGETMNHKRIHDDIIKRARVRELTGYSEKHHVIPKCMGGSNKKDNLVKLTSKEHFIVHKLLCELYPNNVNIKRAYWIMCNAINKYQNRDYIVSSNEYKRIREWLVTNNGFTSNGMLGKNHSDETKYKLSKLAIERDQSGENNPFYGKTHSDEVLELLQKKSTGIIPSVETRKKMRDSSSIGTKWYHKLDGTHLRTNDTDERIKTEGWIQGRYGGKVLSKKANNAKKKYPKRPTSNKKCMIDGKQYNSSIEASKILKLNESTLRDRLVGRFRSTKYKDKYKDWYYID